MKIRTVEKVGIYRVNANWGGSPSTFVPRSEAVELVKCGWARIINRGTAIQLVDEKSLTEQVRGTSCKPAGGTEKRMRLMDWYVAGKPWARDAINGWKGIPTPISYVDGPDYVPPLPIEAEDFMEQPREL